MKSNVRLAEVSAFRGMEEEALSTLTRFRDVLVFKDENAPAQICWQEEISLSPFPRVPRRGGGRT